MSRAAETATSVAKATAVIASAIDEGLEQAPGTVSPPQDKQASFVTFAAGREDDKVEEEDMVRAQATTTPLLDSTTPHSLGWRRAIWYRCYLEAIWAQVVSGLQGTLAYSYLTERHEHRYPHRAHVMASSGVPVGEGAGVDMRGIVPSQCYTVLRAYEWRPLPPRPG